MTSLGLLRCVAALGLSALVLITPARVSGQTADEYVRQQMARHRIPGMAVAVARNGQLLEVRVYGLADVEHQIPVTSGTVFEIASVTKPVTATGVMLLVEDGRIRLDTPIGTYLEGLPQAWSPITVRHLLSHTSGLKDYLNDRLVDRQRTQTPRELVETVFPESLRFVPGAGWSYSNTNYLLLELLIERMTGMRFDQFLAQRIFRPLGLTTMGRRDLRAIVPGRSSHYDIRGDTLLNAAYLNPAVWDHGDGGLVSSAVDLFRFDSALAHGALVQPGTLREMWTPTRLKDGEPAPYGLGWETGDVRGERYVGHNGGRAGVSSAYVHFVDANLTVIALSNLSGINLRRELIEGIAGRYAPALRPLRERPIADKPDPEQTARALAYLRDVARGNRDSRFVTTRNRDAVAEPQKSLTQMLDAMESFQAIGCDSIEERNIERKGTRIARICHYRMPTAARIVFLSLYLANDGLVADQVAAVEDR